MAITGNKVILRFEFIATMFSDCLKHAIRARMYTREGRRMNQRAVVVFSMVTLLLFVCLKAFSEDRGRHSGTTIVPSSSIEKREDIGKRAHTHIRLHVPADSLPPAPAQTSGPPVAGYLIETPASIGCIYKLTTPLVKGCNPNKATAIPAGGSKAIAIVDAYDDPNAASDLAVFSSQFGLPAANFKVVYASGYQPSIQAGWALEESLDIEWAHAMAPNATLYLVEAASSYFDDLFAAVQVASQLVGGAGGGEVSMSWGGSEYCNQVQGCETQYDGYFTNYPGIVYFASTGDTEGTEYPSVSPYVVAVGGTSVRRSQAQNAFGDYLGEFAWEYTGGGESEVEARPGYQSKVKSVDSYRGVPDVASIADPNNGVWVYCSVDSASSPFQNAPGWFAVGGTSVAAPTWAGIVNRAGTFAKSSIAELTTMYNTAGDFTDIKAGICGFYNTYAASKGWDFCTGLGTPTGYKGK